ncbi:hypothetical protein FOA52_003145 [Chlamydomonas sp. UWO 241]|nr:hypothetical protein FOA52_003145 [Chlamydomonas sp. UWO 241]
MTRGSEAHEGAIIAIYAPLQFGTEAELVARGGGTAAAALVRATSAGVARPGSGARPPSASGVGAALPPSGSGVAAARPPSACGVPESLPEEPLAAGPAARAPSVSGEPSAAGPADEEEKDGSSAAAAATGGAEAAAAGGANGDAGAAPDEKKLDEFVNFLHGDNPGACMFHAQMRLNAEGCRKLSNFIKSSGRVRALSLSHNHIGDDGLIILCEGLALNMSVTSLDLPDNSISDRGIQALVEALAKNSSLTQLQLAYNQRIISPWAD